MFELRSLAANTSNLLRFAACLLAIGIGGELGARLDEYVTNGIDPLSTPSQDDLWMSDDGVLVGRPQARFKAIRFNNVGLQGPDIEPIPQPGCPRVLFIGSSETFGHPNVKHGAYPDKVAQRLRASACAEILNGAIPGMTAKSMLPYWGKLASLRPDVVFIYPSTLFYLGGNERPVAAPAGATNASPATATAQIGVPSMRELLDRSRLYARLQDAIVLPTFIQRQREDEWLRDKISAHEPSWVFDSIPADRLERLRNDVVALVDAVRATGATPILMSHAVSVDSPAGADDREHLRAMRVIVPRAPEPILAEFPYKANQAFRALAESKGVRLVDTARALSGQERYFADMVHFTPAGSDEVARLVIESLQQELRKEGR